MYATSIAIDRVCATLEEAMNHLNGWYSSREGLGAEHVNVQIQHNYTDGNGRENQTGWWLHVTTATKRDGQPVPRAGDREERVKMKHIDAPDCCPEHGYPFPCPACDNRHVMTWEDAESLWHAITEEAVAWVATMTDAEPVDFHNRQIAADRLDEEFQRVTGHDPKTFSTLGDN